MTQQQPRFGPSHQAYLQFLGLILVLAPAFALGQEPEPAKPTEPAKPEGPAPASVEYYTSIIEPLLKESCYGCHSHESGESNGLLMVDSGSALKAGGTMGPAVVPGKPDESWMFRAVRYDRSELQMPPDRKLSDPQIESIRLWIEAGAATPPSKWDAEYASRGSGTKGNTDHWAYQPPKASVDSGAGVGTHAIDQLLSKRLKEQGLSFSPRADRATLLTRLFYDLLGLAPSFDEVQQFVQDQRGDALVTANKVDELLSSPHFGERWARHWMDIARYADTKGYVFQENREYAEAYRYRDWLVQAFNRDMPYADFVRAQIAADLVPGGEADIPALGFLTLGRRFLNNRHDIIDDRLDVIGRGIMGMTVACARCHDHKYDPISQADYYALVGVFLNTDEPGGEPFAHRLVDSSERRESRILVRGNPGNPGDVVQRRFVSFLDPENKPFADGSGRLDLVARITEPTNPLTYRVMVNRVWAQLMGESLTESPSDLGTRCPPPIHQDLLDQMAVDFVNDGGSIKGLIRRIVLSDAYAQSSKSNEPGQQIDPANRYYWRANRRRRDLEAMRDRLLIASNDLDHSLGGQAVKIDQSPFPSRRTIYAYLDRQNLPGFFRNFDMASPDAHTPSRPRTTVPQQGLFFLNSDFVARHASGLGQRMAQTASADGNEAAIRWLTRNVLARDPSPDELRLMGDFLGVKVEVEPVVLNTFLGYGEFDPLAGTVHDFKPLPSFVDGRWHGSGGLPDPQLGWVMLSAQGGHAGNDLKHAAIRRWIAPQDGTLRINGTLKHATKEGDGVRATIVVSTPQTQPPSQADQGPRGDQAPQGGAEASSGAPEMALPLGQWFAHDSQCETEADGFEVRAGQAIDFVTDCLGTNSHDSFEWKVKVRYQAAAGKGFDSQRDFAGPAPHPLDAWALLAQALLASNEFAFVD